MRRISLMLAVLMLPGLALADPPRELKRRLNAAVSAVDDAQDAVSRARQSCRDAVSSDLDNVGDRLEGLRAKPKARSIRRVQQLLQNVAQAAPLNGCPIRVLESLQTAQDALEEARIAARPGRPGDDDDDDEDQGPPTRGFATLQPLKVTVNSVFENEPAVRLQVPELTLTGLRGQTFYMGARFRSYEGEWSEWVTTQRWSVPNDPFTWKNPFNHFFRYSRLAEEDFSDGRFVAKVSVFDAQGNELATREVTFKVRLPTLAQPPPPVVVVPPPPVVAARDCGTGPNDPGCGLARDGNWPMDAATFLGFLQSMRANGNEMLRLDMANSVLQRQYLTAAQLGMTMDFFANEMLKLELAKRAAAHVVNPQHALGLAAKFANNMLSTAFTQLMSQQRVGQPMQPVPLQPYQPPPPPPPVVRDCGTGQDPGCGMSRNGRWAMDSATYQGFMQSLRANNNEFGKEAICDSMFANNMITAAQLGAVLDLFQNELTRMEVAKKAAPVLVNPQHALGFASKWRNGLIGQEYTQLMASQRVAP